MYSLGTPVPPTSPDSSSNWEDLTRKYRVAEEVVHCFGIPRHHAWDIPEVSDSPWECQDSSMTVLGAHPCHSHPPGHIKSFSLKVSGRGTLLPNHIISALGQNSGRWPRLGLPTRAQPNVVHKEASPWLTHKASLSLCLQTSYFPTSHSTVEFGVRGLDFISVGVSLCCPNSQVQISY